MAVVALQQIRKMRGGAQSHLMLGSDGEAYVVKFRNNPQHVRVLANEFMGTKLGGLLGLSVPGCDIIYVSDWLIDNTSELTIELSQARIAICSAGLQFGSRLVGGLMPGQTMDYLPEERLADVRNLEEFNGALVLDKWTCNSNGRQAIFHKSAREKKYRTTFIDQGYCFHAGEWTFVDAPLRGVYGRNTVYRSVTGWESFEPWLSRMINIDPQTVWEIAEAVPPEWYEGEMSALEQLVERLLSRRVQVSELIDSFRESSRNPFPNWKRGRKM